MDKRRRFSAGFGFDSCEPGCGHPNLDSNGHANPDSNGHGDADTYAHSRADASADANSDSHSDANRHADAEAHASAGSDNAQKHRDRQYAVGRREPGYHSGAVRSGSQ